MINMIAHSEFRLKSGCNPRDIMIQTNTVTEFLIHRRKFLTACMMVSEPINKSNFFNIEARGICVPMSLKPSKPYIKGKDVPTVVVEVSSFAKVIISLAEQAMEEVKEQAATPKKWVDELVRLRNDMEYLQGEMRRYNEPRADQHVGGPVPIAIFQKVMREAQKTKKRQWEEILHLEV